MKVKNLSLKEKKSFRSDHGVKIIAVPEAYRRYNLIGKVIIEIGESEITDIEQARELCAQISRYGYTSITLLNENRTRERIIFQ